MKSISENIRDRPFPFQWGVSQWVRHLPTLHRAARTLSSAWQPHIAPVQRCTPAKSSTGTAVCTPLWQRHEVLGSLTAGRGRIKPLPEELLHILGGRFQGNHLQSHKYPFLSCPTTDSTRLLIASADCRTPFVWILGLDSHWHSPTTSKSSGCMSAAPLNPGTWQGDLCSAPEPSQGEAH